jgi:hypothetical protein
MLTCIISTILHEHVHRVSINMCITPLVKKTLHSSGTAMPPKGLFASVGFNSAGIINV